MNSSIREDCSALLALKLLGRKWVPWIICELLGVKEIYFSELLKKIEITYGEKISARVLSASLTKLEEMNIVLRKVESNSMPIRVKYSLTEAGLDFQPILGILKGWGVKWGSLSQKKCQSYSCVHTCIPIMDMDEAKKLIEVSESKVNRSFEQLKESA